MTVEDLQRSLDGYEAEVVRARDTCITVLDNFAGLLKNMRGEITLAVEELDKLQRLGGAMRARNQSEQERANKSRAEIHAEGVRERKAIESERKQWEREKESVRRTFDDILAGKKVA